MKNFFFAVFKRTCHLLAGTHIGSYPPAAKLYHFLMDRLHPNKIVIDGITLFLDPHDSLALSLFPEYEKTEMSLIKSVVKKNMVVIELGAYIGDQTILISKLVGAKGHVFAFEPNPSHVKLLEKNVTFNKAENVTIVKKAVSNKNGKLGMYLNPENLADHRIYESKGWEKIAIEVTTLDDYFKNFKKTIGFLKMDIQGAEGEALLGMKKLLTRNKHIKILAEFWPEGLEKSLVKPIKFLQLLKDLGFILSYLDENNGKIRKASINQIVAASKADPLKCYINIYAER